MRNTGGLLTALLRVVRAATGRADVSAPAARNGRAGSDAPVGTGAVANGGGAARTVEVDPARLGRVRLGYAPARDGDPDPGEIVWTWVPYQENDGRGKDRPVVIVAAGDDGTFLAVQLTSKAPDPWETALPLGSGPWDPQGRPSWVRTDRVFRVRAEGIRREAAALDTARYREVAGALAARYGWR